MGFAEGTDVSVDRSRTEIERMLRKEGATRIATMWESDYSMVVFESHGLRVRFEVHTPPLADFQFTEKGRKRDPRAMAAARESEERRLWRALAIVIKAKFEAVNSKVSEFRDEFLANIVLPNNETIGDWLLPQIAEIKTGKMPPLLPSGTKGKS